MDLRVRNVFFTIFSVSSLAFGIILSLIGLSVGMNPIEFIAFLLGFSDPAKNMFGDFIGDMCFFLGIIFIILGLSLFQKLNLEQISKIRFYSIFVLSVFSIAILTYQTIEYFKGLGCCDRWNPEIVKAFREYGTFLGIPISIFGIIQMTSTLIFLVYLSTIPSFPANSSFDNSNYQRFLGLVYYLLLIMLIISSVVVINLIYIEFFLIKSFCLPCTTSQITIFSNTLLIIFWKPFEIVNSTH